MDKIEQLFNSMDPSPFYEKDLDDDAEEFIVSWAQEFPRRDRSYLRELARCFSVTDEISRELSVATKRNEMLDVGALRV